MKNLFLCLVLCLLVFAAPVLDAFYLSSTLPLYFGLPIESDVIDEARHDFLIGFNWNAYFGVHFGLGVDCDFLVGGSDGLKVYGAFTLLWHFNDIWSKKNQKFDPFIGIGAGWTDAPGYYTDTGGTIPEYTPVVEFTGAIQGGFNYWFSDSFGWIVKTKFFFNRGFDFLQLNVGINIKLYSFDIKMPQ
jgi:hypothetical protein